MSSHRPCQECNYSGRVPLKGLVEQLRALGEAGYSYAGEAADEIDLACKRSEFWKANHLAGNAEIDRLRVALKKIAATSQTDDLLWWQKVAREALAPNDV